jgi:hypothetical protein
MKGKRYLDDLINRKLFRFDRLIISGIDNERVAELFSSAILREEICLFANTIADGNEYCKILHDRISDSLQNNKPLPIARFADGEYAFYRYTLGCNGLYKQAESIEAIKKVMPLHITAMKCLADHGLLAPLIFPGNAHVSSRSFFSFRNKERDSSGADFLDFLNFQHISLTSENYIPFYVVYAYLSSAQFASAMNGKNICILNSEYNKENCRQWFHRFGSAPELEFVEIPAEYVATRWGEIKAPILSKIPARTDLCIVGAGVGALLICADISRRLAIPVIDAGHILNMMNGRADKSNGARLYTLRKE